MPTAVGRQRAYRALTRPWPGWLNRKTLTWLMLQRVLRCAFQMSEQNLGAIFVLGDADAIWERSDPPEISSFRHDCQTRICSTCLTGS